MYKGIKIYKNENGFYLENGIKISEEYSENEIEKIIDNFVEIMEKMK